MKGSEHFKQTIKAYLDKRAGEDELFARSYAKENKNFEECISYIFGEVQKIGDNGYDDDEVHSMAVHYYDEDNLEIGTHSISRVVVNHPVELTEEEKEQAWKEAMEQVRSEEYARMHKKPAKPKAEPDNVEQTSLF